MKILELKNKIPKFLVLPLIILFTFSIYSGVNKLQERAIYSDTHKYMHFTMMSSGLIHELQKERGYSSGFTASNGKSFLLELKQQREKSDKKIELLKVFLNNFDFGNYKFSFQKPTQELLLSLSKLDRHREDVDNIRLNSSESVRYYTDNINILLKLMGHVVTISNNSELSVLTQSFMILVKIKEKAGIERALINRVFSQGELSSNEFYAFGALVSAQEVYLDSFKSIALPEHVNQLSKELTAASSEEIIKERNIVYAKNQKNEILSSIKQYVGYGGLIHNFKNYVIRGEKKYASDVKKQYAQLLGAIDKYKIIEGVTREEIDRLNIIKDVFLEYMQGVSKVTTSYKKGGTIPAIDKIVKVDDGPAIKALQDLTTHIYGSQLNWFKHSTFRINSLKKVEDTIASDIHILIDTRSLELMVVLVIQAIVLLVILIITVLLAGMFRELIESEKRLNMAQVNTKSGSYEYHIEENIIIWSDEHYKLLEVDKKTFKPTIESFMSFVHPDDVDIVKDGLELAVDSKDVVSFEYRMILPDNKEMFVMSSAEVIKLNKKGKPLVIVGTITDISESKKLKQEIIDTQKDVIFTMGAIGETRSKETGQHVKRVAEYSKLLYTLIGADRDDVELLKMASPMHDIGKVGIPDDILHKPGKLTPGEWAIMQTHSEMGYEMLKNSDRDILKLAATVALTHHERYDGSGYPNGLLANEIPLVGRITALADVFDALGSDRCYKTAWELEKILELIKTQRAKQFDPQLVDLFLENLDKFLEIRDRHKDII